MNPWTYCGLIKFCYSKIIEITKQKLSKFAAFQTPPFNFHSIEVEWPICVPEEPTWLSTLTKIKNIGHGTFCVCVANRANIRFH